MRPLYDLDAITYLQRETRRIARDHANRRTGVKKLRDDLLTDHAGGRGNYDHVELS
jgi:hypothetical protein